MEVIYSRAEYTEKRLILLEQLIFRMWQITEQYLPPTGQQEVKDVHCTYQNALKELGGIPKKAI